jgi:gamma-glutamyl:cysteine ligase YbdK (ATP-grasp superfamily)
MRLCGAKGKAMNELEVFSAKFPFQDGLRGYIGIERERFLLSPDGTYAPRSQEFLGLVRDPAWTYELSACQVEDRTSPCYEETDILRCLRENDGRGEDVVRALGLRVVATEVGPADMPMDVYPDPRYLQIVQHMSPARLAAACRVIGTHIHVGVASWKHAFSVYHALASHLDELACLGDHSQGERIRLYREVAPAWQPPYYENLAHFFETARAEGFSENPRDCWHMVRITGHGTVECRMFGAAQCPEEVLGWVARIRAILA